MLTFVCTQVCSYIFFKIILASIVKLSLIHRNIADCSSNKTN